VHEKILDDRPLDEAHPLWPTNHYGAHKAAIEKFIHSYGYGDGFPICSLRPTGIYGIDHPLEQSKWFSLVQDVVQGRPVDCRRGGKEVHASDVAKAVGVLLEAPSVAGEAFNCYDRYIAEYEVAQLALEFAGRDGTVTGQMPKPKHQIETQKIRRLGMQFGGEALLRHTIRDMVQAISSP
jgi:nucleoside-diphosphate-sugar epimerase